jgi:hypothetical protein
MRRQWACHLKRALNDRGFSEHLENINRHDMQHTPLKLFVCVPSLLQSHPSIKYGAAMGR